MADHAAEPVGRPVTLEDLAAARARLVRRCAVAVAVPGELQQPNGLLVDPFAWPRPILLAALEQAGWTIDAQQVEAHIARWCSCYGGAT